MAILCIWKFLVCSAHAGPGSHRLFYRTGEFVCNLAVAVAGGLAWPAAVSCGREVWLAVSRQGLKPRSQETVSERRRGQQWYVY